LADQFAYSAGNFLLVSQLAHGLGARRFGSISLLYTIELLVVTLVRSVASEVQLSERRRDDADNASLDRTIRRFVGSLALVALGIAAGAGVLSRRVVPCFLLAALPALLLNDRARFEAFQRRDPRRAALMDVTWLIAQVGLVIMLGGSLLHPRPAAAVVAWGLGAVASLGFAIRLPPGDADKVNRWLGRNRRAMVSVLGQALFVNAAATGAVAVFTVTGAPEWGSGFVIAMSAAGPQAAVMVALRPLLLGALAADAGSTRRDTLRLATTAAAASAAVLLAAGVLLAGFGHALYGKSARFALREFPLLAVGRAFGAASVVCNAALRGRSRWSHAMLVEAASALALLVAMTIGRVAGPQWVAAGFAVGCAASLAAYAVSAARALAEPLVGASAAGRAPALSGER
jgi:hypothetical protein